MPVAMSDVDKSLDDIISAKRGRGGSRGNRRRGSFRGNRNQNFRRQGFGNSFKKIPATQGPVPKSSGPIKLNISNLEFGVTDKDVWELFQEFGGAVKSGIHYDASGRSLGTAYVIYSKYENAQKAFNSYNGICLDGRPMRLQIEGSPSGFKPDRLSALQNSSKGFGGRRPRGGSRGGKGFNRGGRRGGRGGKNEPTPSAEALDAELDAYLKEKEEASK